MNMYANFETTINKLKKKQEKVMNFNTAPFFSTDVLVLFNILPHLS